MAAARGRHEFASILVAHGADVNMALTVIDWWRSAAQCTTVVWLENCADANKAEKTST